MFAVHGDLVVGDPLDQLHYPAASGQRMAGRDLEVASGAARAPAPRSGTLWEALHGGPADSLFAAIAVEEDLLAYYEHSDFERAEGARLRLVLLLGEAGETGRALELAETAGDRDLLLALRFLYAEGADPPSDAFEARVAALETWLHSTPCALAGTAARGDTAAAQRQDALLRESAARHYAAARASLAATGLLVLAGLGVILGQVLRRPRASATLGPPPWTLADGLGVWLRADCWNRLYFAALLWVPAEALPPAVSDLLWDWGTLFASLPLVWLAWRHLVRPHRDALRDPFGLISIPFLSLGGYAVAALAIDLIGTYALAWAGFAAGLDGHWSEGFDETLVWGSGPQALLAAADYALWAPLFEELSFRGVLYLSLRRALGPAGAALASAGIFGAVHFYSLSGFAGTLWSGFCLGLGLRALAQPAAGRGRARRLQPALRRRCGDPVPLVIPSAPSEDDQDGRSGQGGDRNGRRHGRGTRDGAAAGRARAARSS